MAIVAAALRALPAGLGPRGIRGVGRTGHAAALVPSLTLRQSLRRTSSIAYRYETFAPLGEKSDTTMNKPRKHHFVPVNYLKGFTPSGDSTDQLQVIDLERGTTWRARPAATGFENDYYRIHKEGFDENAVEYAFGKVENEVAPALQRVRRTRAMTDADLEDILAFISIQSIRGFAFRWFVRQSLEHSAKAVFQHITESDGNFTKAKELLAEHGLAAFNASREEIQEAIDAGGMELELDHSEVVLEALAHQPQVFSMLAERQWSLAFASDVDGQFVTSDNPLSLGAQLNPSPGVMFKLGFPWSTYYFPLSPRVCLVGYRQEAQEQIDVADSYFVSVANAQVTGAARYVYASSMNFSYWTQGGFAATGKDLLEAVLRAKAATNLDQK